MDGSNNSVITAILGQMRQRILGMSTAVAWVALAVTTPAGAAQSTDWPTYGNDPGSSKYADLDQINATNVGGLKVAWFWESPDNKLTKENPRLRAMGYKSTPIKIDGVLYISTSLGLVAAIDAHTGEELWVFDTRTYADGRPTNLGFNHRGVAHWSDGKASRILMPTNNARLWSLDAMTGKPDPGFGEDGSIDLTQGLGRPVSNKNYSVVAAPIIVKDVVVVGSVVMDGPRNKEMPPGHVRGFDVRTGRQQWTFHTIPQRGEMGVETWEDESWQYTGNTNVWTLMSADPELGYVYLPTSTPTNDWYGGHRLGDNLFAESLVCVDAATGKRVWHFQMVHHGLWDYDLPAAPNLVDITIDGRVIKAVAQVSKQAFVYVFNRVTGEPIWPIVETPVPQSDVPGERTSPTQPIPTRPAPFDLQGVTDDNLINFTPELKAEAREIIKKFDHGPIFTPPSLRGTINLPGWGGGANWSGAAVDPETAVLYVPSATGPMVVALSKPDPEVSNFAYGRGRGVGRLRGPDGLPLTKPPYGRITAIDLKTGDHLWMVPHGDGIRQRIIDKGIKDPGPVGSGGTGPVLTKSLLFLAQQDGRRSLLRAFDKVTGETIAEVELPSRPSGTPMTYMSGGEQFIALTVSGGKAGLVGLSLGQ